MTGNLHQKIPCLAAVFVVGHNACSQKTGTVQTGALWSEEYLPTDTLMYSLILIPSIVRELRLEELKEEKREHIKDVEEASEKIKKILGDTYNEKVLQIGGNETIGKGFARIKIV